MNINGYETITTFWEDFGIADRFGIDAVKDTYRRAFNEWKDNYKYLTELVMVLNWQCWLHYERHNEKLSRLYGELYYGANDYALEHLKGDELTYYYRTTD